MPTTDPYRYYEDVSPESEPAEEAEDIYDWSQPEVNVDESGFVRVNWNDIPVPPSPGIPSPEAQRAAEILQRNQLRREAEQERIYQAAVAEARERIASDPVFNMDRELTERRTINLPNTARERAQSLVENVPDSPATFNERDGVQYVDDENLPIPTRRPRDLVHNYTTRVEQNLPFYGNPGDGRFFGIELECQVNPNSIDFNVCAQRTIDALGAQFVMLKRDASIGEFGFEIVTAPATLEVHHMAWNDFLSNRIRGLTSYLSGDCGMHVHVSRPSAAHVVRIRKFINALGWRTEMYAIAGRPNNRHTLYNEDTDFDPIFDVRDSLRGAVQTQTRFQFITGDHHDALNCSNQDTIEFRIFRGTLNRESFFKNLEFVHAVTYFTEVESARVQTWDNFVEFVRKSKHEYPNLCLFLQEKLNIAMGRVMRMKNPVLSNMARVEKKLVVREGVR